MPRLAFPSAAALLAIAACSLGTRPCVAATSFDHVAQAWMGAVAFLADDEGRERADRDRGERDRGERDRGQRDRGEGGRRQHGAHPHGQGPRPGMEGPRVVMAKMDEILDRLARIEAKLDRRAGGLPPGAWSGPRPPHGGPGPRPEMRERGRRMMEESPGMDRGGDRRRPEVPEEVREQMRRRMEGAQAEMRKRMEEGRERMEQARQKFREMEERIKKLEAEIERLKQPPTAAPAPTPF